MVKEYLKNYIQNPNSPIFNFEVGMAYYREKHYSSAITYLHRAAELSNDPMMEYKCMVLCCNALFHRGERPHQVKGFALHAISILPERPEAWFVYSRTLEIQSEWQECYASACTSLKLCDFNQKTFEGSEYPGKYVLFFEKAISAWNIGRLKETIDTLLYIKKTYLMTDFYQALVDNNLKNLTPKYEESK